MAKLKSPETNYETIRQVPCNEQMRLDYGCYTYFVALERICPDYRDGLLNVHRAIITAAAINSGAISSKVKSAAIVGDVMKYYHPHGDASIYQSLTNLGCYFGCRYPLIAKKGSFGTIDGDQPAHYRYTEASLSPFARDVIVADLKRFGEDISVDWVDNYSKTIKMPEYLPAKLPILLLKGQDNIGVGDTIVVPSHNLCEVVDAMITLIKNPKAKITLIPDLPLETELLDTDWKKISATGVGKYTARAIIDVIPYRGHKKAYTNCMCLNVKSLPPEVTLNSVIDSIEKLVENRKIPQIIDYESHAKNNPVTDELNVDIDFILSEGADPNYVKMLLYKHTRLQNTYTVNMIVKKDRERHRCGYAEYLNEFIEYRRNFHRRFLYNKLVALNTETEKMQSLIDLIKSGLYDKIEDWVRKQKKEVDLEPLLIEKFKVNPVQAKYCLDAKLKHQASFALQKMSEGVAKNNAEAQGILETVRNPEAIDQIIIDEILKLRDKYGDARRSKVIKNTGTGPSGRFLVSITDSNRIKLQGLTEPLSCSKGDSIKQVLDIDVSGGLIVFTDNGRCYKIPGEKIPFSPAGTSGEDIRIVNKHVGGNIIFITSEEILNTALKNKDFLISLTKAGFIKKVSLDDFTNIPGSGTTFCKLDAGDKVIDAGLSRPDMRILVYNHDKALCLDMDSITWAKRNARGSMSMKSTDGKPTMTEGMTAVLPNMSDILVITNKGCINRISPSAIKVGRAKSGSSVIKLKPNDGIHSIIAVEPGHTVELFCTNEIVSVPVDSIKPGSSISTGVKCVKAASGDIIKTRIV